MQNNYDFHLRHQLVDASQMFGEMESFYYNRSVHNVYWYGKPKFLTSPHLIQSIDSQITGKWFLIVVKTINWRRRNSCFSTPSLGELGTYVKGTRCYEVLVIHHDFIYEPFDS